MAEQAWQHLVVQVNSTTNNKQLVVTPSQPDLGTNLYDITLGNVVALLNELGADGWQLVSVRDSAYWLRRPAPDTSGQEYAYVR